MRIALIGYGYWGPNLLRNFIGNKAIEEVKVSDTDPRKLNILQRKYYNITTCADPLKLIKDRTIDAVAIATPVSTHFDLAIKALRENKHVLVEKPMVSSLGDAETLIDTAISKKLTLMVDHTFLYNGVVRKIKDIIDAGALGHINYIDSKRINLGIYHSDINVVWDLACHDLSIINYLIDSKPETIRCIGKLNSGLDIEDIAHLFLTYSSGAMIHINCSWASPVKIRSMIFGGDKRMLIYDDIEPTDKLKVYDFRQVKQNGRNRNNILVDYRLGDVTIPKFSLKEPLSLMAEEFIKAVETGTEPIPGYENELEIIKILSLADKSIKKNGAEIKLQ